MNQHIAAAFRDALALKSGEIGDFSEKIKAREHQISVLNEAYKILAPDAPTPEFKPRRVLTAPRAKRGSISGSVIEALKRHPMSFGELLEAVSLHVGFQRDTYEWRAWSKRITLCIANLKTKGLVVTDHVDGIQKYRLIPPRPT